MTLPVLKPEVSCVTLGLLDLTGNVLVKIGTTEIGVDATAVFHHESLRLELKGRYVVGTGEFFIDKNDEEIVQSFLNKLKSDLS